jgi:hypothetical protein
VTDRSSGTQVYVSKRVKTEEMKVKSARNGPYDKRGKKVQLGGGVTVYDRNCDVLFISMGTGILWGF